MIREPLDDSPDILRACTCPAVPGNRAFNENGDVAEGTGGALVTGNPINAIVVMVVVVAMMVAHAWSLR